MEEENPHFQYPITACPTNPQAWKLTVGQKVYFQVPVEFIDKYIFKIVDSFIELVYNPNYNPISYTTLIVTSEFFVSFMKDVVDFLKLHQLELVYPLVREGVVLSLQRNSKYVEMRDIQPCLAKRYKVWTFGTSLEFFMKNRKPKKRYSTQKCKRGLLSKFRDGQSEPTI